MNITYSKQFLKQISKLDKSLRDKVLNSINGLLEIPPAGDIKSLQGRSGYRLRIGKYRVIYRIDGDNIIIDEIGSRGDIYK